MATPDRILVVDDNPVNRMILTRSLQKAGYEVTEAQDGFEAVDLANENPPDLILLDVMMPERDGLEVCAILKSQEQTQAIPVIFVTARTDSKQIVEAFAAGGSDYVTKPFHATEILARVSVHIRLRRAERDLIQRSQYAEQLAAELARTNAELALLSRIDPLTKLLNRRAWEEAALHEQDRFERQGHVYSVVMIDVDHFKRFNDSQGHQAGDDVLQRVAAAITSICRLTDVAGRYGGEEFILLAPDTESESAHVLGERVRQAIWDLNIPHPDSQTAPRVTISAGVASSGEPTLEKVIKAADDALYDAKNSGRNRVVTATACPSPMAGV